MRIEEELSSTKEKLDMAQRELASASLDLQRAARFDQNTKNLDVYTENTLEEQDFDLGVEFDKPKSAKNYIPEGTYFTGHLLGGLAVSTGLNTPDENATPVSIKLMGRFDAKGRLTTNLSSLNKTDLQHCRIMGSAYGDLSSERAIVRAEVLSCTDPVSELIYTTKIAGLIHGDDGMNGIKGKVIQTSGKHLKNAIVGSMISGFAGSAKGQDQMIITSFGAGATKKKGMGDMLQEKAFAGASNAAEKIADYYIKQAESMSPVLLVSGGTKVDIVFTKGVYLSALDVQEKLEQSRQEKAKKQ